MKDIIDLQSRPYTRRAPAGGFATPAMQKQSRQIIERIGGPPSQRASKMKKSTQPAYNTEDDEQIAPSTRPPARTQTGQGTYRHTEENQQLAPITRPAKTQPGNGANWKKCKRNFTPKFLFFLGMAVMLILWIIGVYVDAWVMNNMSDPSYYTQSAHRDSARLSDSTGKSYQVHAFVDGKNRIDLLILPEGDASKAHIMVGPQLSMINDPQKALLEIKVIQGTQITVSASGPYEVSWLSVSRNQSTQWQADASKQQKEGQP